MQETEPWVVASTRRRSRRRRRIAIRGWIALGALVAVGLTAGGGVLAYENTLPTSVGLNPKNGDRDVPVYSHLVLTFSRQVAPSTLGSAFSIVPATDGTLTARSGQTQYEWAPSKPLDDLTTYTVTLTPMMDESQHRVPGGRWTFTTNIVPRILSVTGVAGAALTDGSEIDPGTPLTIKFNDAMQPTTLTVTVGGTQANLKWAADDRSATISTERHDFHTRHAVGTARPVDGAGRKRSNRASRARNLHIEDRYLLPRSRAHDSAQVPRVDPGA